MRAGWEVPYFLPTFNPLLVQEGGGRGLRLGRACHARTQAHILVGETLLS